MKYVIRLMFRIRNWKLRRDLKRQAELMRKFG